MVKVRKNNGDLIKNHNIGLDYMRIFAMASVILVHIGAYLDLPENIRPLFSWGAGGVHFFFVLSGYLAATTFQRGIKAIDYYIKRGLRIIPAYYTIIILAIFYNIFIVSDVSADIYYIGWLRYFLGLNMIIPSANYALWNNLYGLWTMSCFIWFYVFAPIIFKNVQSLKKALLFLIVSIGIAGVWKKVIMLTFSQNSMLEKLDVLSGGSPFGMLYQFAIGILVFFIIKENKFWFDFFSNTINWGNDIS